MNLILNEKQKYLKKILIDCIKKNKTTAQAAFELCLTQRAIEIKIQKYNKYGDKSLIHGNTGNRYRASKFDQERKKIIQIYSKTKIDGQNPFQFSSFSLFNQILQDEYNIFRSDCFVKNILKSLGHISPCNKKIKKQVNHLFRPRKENFGELIQGDGTEYDWFGTGEKFCIQGFVDDATGIPVGLYMTKNECLLGYLEATRSMLIDYGIPEQMYPNKAQVFFVNNSKDGKKHLSQFGRIMEELGVDMFPAHSPQAKGRIERFWGTIKQQLPVLFKVHKIKTVEAANKFIHDIYIPRFIKHFAKKPKSNSSRFVLAKPEDITRLLKARYVGNTDNAGIFSFHGYKFFCEDLPKQKIYICISEKDGVWAENFKTHTKHNVVLVETDTSGDLPEVTKNLIEKTFLRNAKPKFREVYYDFSDQLVS